METGQKNRNRDIYKLKGCQGMLDEIRMLREKDSSERRALIGSPRFDGCRMEAAGAALKMLARAQAIHEKRLQAIEAYEAQIAECEKVLQRVDNPTHRR